MGLVKQGSKPTGTVTKIDINNSLLDWQQLFKQYNFRQILLMHFLRYLESLTIKENF